MKPYAGTLHPVYPSYGPNSDTKSNFRFSPYFNTVARYCEICDGYVANYEGHLRNVHGVHRGNTSDTNSTNMRNTFHVQTTGLTNRVRSLIHHFTTPLNLNDPHFHEVLFQAIEQQLMLELNENPLLAIQLVLCGE